MNVFRWLLVAAALATLACLAPAQLPAPLQGVKRIVCLGDSITEFGERPGGYVWLVRHFLNVCYPDSGIKVINAGISGNKSDDMLSRFKKDVLDKKPDVVTISVGVNDVWHGFYDNHPNGDGPRRVKLKDYEANVESMCDQAVAAGAKVVVLTPTVIHEEPTSPENRALLPYLEFLRSYTASKGFLLADTNRAVSDVIASYRKATGSTRDFLTVDGVHMNASGNQVMADEVLDALGVPEMSRLNANTSVMADALAKPKPLVIPPGRIVSAGLPATASSSTPGYPATNANSDGAGDANGVRRWCASGDTFDPPQWWCVDLGSPVSLSGVVLRFYPDDLDTWKVKVETSLDGDHFELAADFSESEDYLTARSVTFLASKAARYLRVDFVAPTSARNWASLSRVDVYAK